MSETSMSNKTKTIALAGHMGSGKDTAAGIVLNIINDAQSYAFADHLKKISVEVAGLSNNEVYGDEKEKELDNPIVLDHDLTAAIHNWVIARNPDYDNMTVFNKAQLLIADGNRVFNTSRRWQQFLGTEILRECYDLDYHINQVAKRIKDDKPSVAVITDARFPNEREWAKEFGATTALIVGRTRDDFNSFNTHASETGLGVPEDYDVVIDNSGTIEDLKHKVVNVLEVLEAL